MLPLSHGENFGKAVGRLFVSGENFGNMFVGSLSLGENLGYWLE